MAPFFERVIAAVVGATEGRRVTVMSSVRESSGDESLDLDLRELPEDWRVVAADDIDALLTVAKGAAHQSDVLVILAPWDEAPASFGTLERAAATWELPEIVACEALPDIPAGGSVVTVVPAGALVGDASRDARAAIMANAYPGVIVEIDAADVRGTDLGQRRGGSAARAAIVMYERRSAGGPVRFATLPPGPGCDLDAVVDDLDRLRSLQGGETNLGFVTREPIRPGDPLSPSYHAPETERHRQAIGIYGAVVPLSHLFAIAVGGREADDEIANRGDFVVTGPGESAEIRLTLKEVAADGVPVEPDSVLMRPSRSLSDDERTFIVAYLQSGRAWRLYEAQGGTRELDSEALGRLPVVLPTELVRLTLAEIDSARTRLRRWDSELEDARKRLFDIDTTAGGLASVLNLGRRARQRVFAGGRVDDLGHRVRTQFPWPLAVLWRTVEAARPDAAGYMRTLEFAEALACYVACLAIVAAREAGVELAAVETMARKLSGTTRGVSFADWAEILQEVRGRSFRAAGDKNPFPEITELMSPDDPADRALRRLKGRRDDLAHNRGPRAARELRDEYEHAGADLRQWVEACEFVSSYPLVWIEATRWDDLRSTNAVEYRELMGDNELTPLGAIELEQPTIEAGSLYVRSQAGALHLLRPLLTWRDCADCGRPAVMVLDQFSSTEPSLVIRSLDHGHTERADELLDAFKEVGLVRSAAK